MAPNFASVASSPQTMTPTGRLSMSSTRNMNGEGPYRNPRTLSAMSSRSDVSSSMVISTTTAVKCEVMIQYLRQRQIEKLWTDGSPAEGVILKRAKNDFVSQPPELSQQVFGFFDEIKKLNVKVLAITATTNNKLIKLGCNDSEDCCYTNISTRIQPAICTPQERPSDASSSEHWRPIKM